MLTSASALRSAARGAARCTRRRSAPSNWYSASAAPQQQQSQTLRPEPGAPQPPGAIFSLFAGQPAGTCWDVLAHWSDRQPATFDDHGLTLHFSHSFDAHLGCPNVTTDVRVTCDKAARTPIATGRQVEGVCAWKITVRTADASVCSPGDEAGVQQHAKLVGGRASAPAPARFSNVAPRRSATDGSIIDAHDGNYVQDADGTWWYFGMGYGLCNDTGTVNGCDAKCGYSWRNVIGVWSSPDLSNDRWTRRGEVLPYEERPAEANCTYFRAHGAYSAATRKWVVWVNAIG